MADLRQMSFLLSESFQSDLESLEIKYFQHCLKIISVFRLCNHAAPIFMPLSSSYEKQPMMRMKELTRKSTAAVKRRLVEVCVLFLCLNAMIYCTLSIFLVPTNADANSGKQILCFARVSVL